MTLRWCPACGVAFTRKAVLCSECGGPLSTEGPEAPESELRRAGHRDARAKESPTQESGFDALLHQLISPKQDASGRETAPRRGPLPATDSHAQPLWQIALLGVLTFNLHTVYWFYRTLRKLTLHAGEPDIPRCTRWQAAWRAAALFVPLLNLVYLWNMFGLISDILKRHQLRPLLSGYLLVPLFLFFWPPMLILMTPPQRVAEVPVWEWVVGAIWFLGPLYVQDRLNEFWEKLAATAAQQSHLGLARDWP